jgi:hypothetical protein
LVFDFPLAFHAARRTSSTAREASWHTWKGSKATSASGTAALTAFS